MRPSGTTRKVSASAAGNRIGALELADAKQLPWGDRVFDAVFLSFTLELFSQDEISVVLREIARVLVAGGRLGVVSLNEDRPDTPMVDLYRFLHRHFPHIVDCQPIDVRAVLERSGFEIIARDGVSIWGLPVAALVARLPGPD